MRTNPGCSVNIRNAVLCAVILLTGAAFAQEHRYVDFLRSADFPNRSSVHLIVSRTIHAYEDTLLVNNPDLRSAWSSWRSAAEQISLAAGLPDPQIQAGYFLEQVQTAVGPQRYRLGVKQTLPWPGKLFVRRSIQKAAADLAYNAFRAKIEQMLLKFRILYVDAWYLKRALAISREHLKLLEDLEHVAVSRYQTDKSGYSSLIRAEIERLRMEDTIASFQSKERAVHAGLRSLLNLPAGSELIISDIPLPENLLLTHAEVVEAVTLYNPDVAAARSRERIAGRRISLSRLQMFPDFGLGLDVIETGPRFDGAGNPVSGSGTNPLIVTGTMTVPVWFGKNRSLLRAEKAAGSGASHAALSAVNVKTAETAAAFNQCEDSRRKTALYTDKLLPRSRESLQASRAAYAAGETDYYTVIDATRLGLQIELGIAEHTAAYQKARAQLAALAGRRL